MKSRKYGESSFIRLAVNNEMDTIEVDAEKLKCLADRWSPCPPTFDNASRLMTKAKNEGDHIAWAASMICLSNMHLMGHL